MTELCLDGWTDKENVVCTDSEMLCNLKKEGTFAIRDNMDEPEKHAK